jgi:hypothetical protein
LYVVNFGTRSDGEAGMAVSHRLISVVLMSAALAACDSMELTIGVESGSNATLTVRNANAEAWSDARLLVETVESDNSTTVCAEEIVNTWLPGESISVPMCGDKVRLTLFTGGEVARFSYVNGQLYRRIGRKEVPIR